jgi:benzoylsuccinyl-CoA thiolase BbsA subunit
MSTSVLEKANSPLLCGDAVERGPDGRAVLIGGRCADCGARAFPKPPVCTGCMGETIVAEKLPRAGTLYAFSVVHIAPKKWKIPMCIGYVDLPDGVRVFTHLEGTDFAIGDTVEVDLGVVGQDESGAIESFVFKRAKT